MVIYNFYLKEKKFKNARSLSVTYITKKTVEHKRALKQELHHGLILKKVHKVMQFDQKAC